MSTTIYSFDVFDTTITRLVGKPTDVFLLLADRLRQLDLWSNGAAMFTALRIRAEAVARANTNSQEVTLAEIYTELAFLTDRDSEWSIIALEKELETEFSLLRPVPQAIARIEELRAQGISPIFISDTYIPGSVLADWLRSLHILRPGDHLYASSDLKLTKQTGDLFRHVAHDLGIDLRSISHTGDNLQSDVHMPASMGIKVQHATACELNLREHGLVEAAEHTDSTSSLHAGTSRLCRLHSQSTDALGEDGIVEIAASVAGPVLTTFVVWLLKKAVGLGITKLLFVARDGQLLQRIADEFICKLNLPLTTQYIYAGRQVVNLAGIKAVDTQALDWILESATGLAPADLLARVNLSVAQVSAVAAELSLTMAGPIRTDEIPRYQELLQHPVVAAKIMAAATAQCEFLRGYFESIGAFQQSCAFVDVGWRGRVFSAINKILGPNRHIALYFGLYGRPAGIKAENMRGFLFEPCTGGISGMAHKVKNLANLIEIFCQATHGQVIGLVKHNGSYKPQLRTVANNVGVSWDIQRFQDVVVRYAAIFPVDIVYQQSVQPRTMVESMLRAILLTPTTDEAHTLGRFGYNDDQGGARIEPFAEPYTCRDIWFTLGTGQFPRKSYVWWAEGARRLTPAYILLLLKIARRLIPRSIRQLHTT